MVKTIIFSDLN